MKLVHEVLERLNNLPTNNKIGKIVYKFCLKLSKIENSIRNLFTVC